MRTVYWSPWTPDESLLKLHLLYDNPVSVLDDIKHRINKDNRGDNWYQCHAFLNSVKNTFVLKFPFDCVFGLDNNFGVIKITERQYPLNYVTVKQPSINNQITFSILNDWIFWSDTPLEILTTPSYLHKSQIDGFYVPGSFNINSWFRPIEAAMQLNENVNTVTINRGDAFAYVKFVTNEPVQLKRFNFNNELRMLAQSCIDYKKHESNRGLSYLYSRFRKNGLHQEITRVILNNLMDSEI